MAKIPVADLESRYTWYKKHYEELQEDFKSLRANLNIYEEQLIVAKEQSAILDRIANSLETLVSMIQQHENQRTTTSI